MKKKIALIDGNSILFRAYFATAFNGSIIKNKKGFPINALLTMHRMIDKILNTYKPDYTLVAFDEPKKTIRHEQLANYKSGRQVTPTELIQQIAPIKEMLKYKGLHIYSREGYEADDIIGTLAKKSASKGYEVHCFSSDKDLFQLVDDNITIQWIKNKGEIQEITPISFAEKYDGLTPLQLIDLKGIEGDSSDNLKGIDGMGKKTGIKLLKKYGSLQQIINSVDDLSVVNREKILKSKEMALLCKKIATIITDMEINFKIEELSYRGGENEKLRTFYQNYGLQQFLSKLPAKNPIEAGEKVIQEVLF